MKENFDKNIADWIRDSLNQNIPKSVKALNFNLSELGFGFKSFEVDLIGSSYFDKNDEDWACDEVWSSPKKSLIMPDDFASNWQDCLIKTKELLTHFIKIVDIDKDHVVAVGIGFVDGEINIVYERSKSEKK